MPVSELPKVDFAAAEFFTRLRDDPAAGLVIANAQISPGGPRWIFPLARRLRSNDGRFGGAIGAAGRTEYFQRFYSETFPDPSTRIALVHREGWLLARHPPAEAMLGKPLDVVATLLPPGGKQLSTVARLSSPVDGVDHFVALRVVPDYPLVVAVSRDASAALASWRSQALATALRTLALGAFAGCLLWVALRQLDRAQASRTALEASEERYALAMTGTGEGHWLWDIPAGKVYISDKLAEIFGLPGGAPARALPALRSHKRWIVLVIQAVVLDLRSKTHWLGQSIGASGLAARSEELRDLCVRTGLLLGLSRGSLDRKAFAIGSFELARSYNERLVLTISRRLRDRRTRE